jgi:hypothetical protein
MTAFYPPSLLQGLALPLGRVPRPLLVAICCLQLFLMYLLGRMSPRISVDSGLWAGG